MQKRIGFTLIEVLISIGLLGLILPALFSAVKMMRQSNAHMLTYLEKSKKVAKGTKVLYLDILSSDGNLKIKRDEQVQLCLEETSNSLYGLSLAKVCWVVLKKENTLVRVEGNKYKLPLKYEDKVEVDKVIKHIEIFDVYHQKDKVLVLLKQQNKEPISFLIQGITKPRPSSAGGVPPGFPKGTKITPDGKWIMTPDGRKYPVGSTMAPNGQVILPKKNTRGRGRTRRNVGNRRGVSGNGGKRPIKNTPPK